MWGTWLFVLQILNINLQQTEPFFFERINEINLSGKCSNVTIVEWQSDKISKEEIEIVDSACQTAVENIKQYLFNKNIKITDNINLNLKISLLKNQTVDRGLNDPVRFFNQENPFDKNGKYITKYGRYYLESKHIYIINKIIKNQQPYYFFQETLSHEIFHAVIDQNNLRKKLPSPTYQCDEEMAVDFASSLAFWQG